MSLDEKALRRPEFAEGVPVALCDGQEWHFPRPEATAFYPQVRPDGTVFLAQGFGFGVAYDRLTDAFMESEDGAERMTLLVAMGVNLLQRNYAVGNAELVELLRIEGEKTRAMWESIREVALGRAPKPTPDGGPPASSPTG